MCKLRILSILNLSLGPIGNIASQGFSLFVDVFFWEQQIQCYGDEGGDSEP
jgi:hypothetical protein